MFSSIKARVIIFYMAILFMILPALGVFLYLSLDKIIYNSIDSGLLSRAKALATLTSSENGKARFIFSDEIMKEYDSIRSNNFFEIRHFDGAIIAKSRSLKKLELPLFPNQNQISYHTIYMNDMSVRVVNFYFVDSGEDAHEKKGPEVQQGDAGFIIQCGVDTDKQEDILNNYGFILIISIFSIIMISAVGAFLIAKKALSPIKEISDIIKGFSESNLSERVNSRNVPKELQELAVSFNNTFEKLEKSFNRQKQLVGDVSHELRTSLSVILSQSEIILRKKRSDDEYKKALISIKDAAEMMSEIVAKLLALARLSNEEIKLKMEPVNVNDLINKAVKTVNPVAALKGVSINLPVRVYDLPVISGDRAALLELAVNILENAIKYNVPKGKINITIDKKGQFFIIRIQDTGIGISCKDIDKVFDRFYRADTSRSKEVGGIGLGLSICREIVRLHGGRIEIKSTVGVGTTVSICMKENGY